MMKTLKIIRTRSIYLLFLLGLLLALGNAAPIFGQDTAPQPTPFPENSAVEMNAENAAVIAELRAPETQLIRVNFNPTGTGRCTVDMAAWPEDAKKAVLRAADIWSSLLNGSQEIVIDVCWSNDKDLPATGEGLLANCGASGTYYNFQGAPLQNTLYVLPLANQLYGGDLNGASPDMQCRFNANREDWYIPIDGIVPASKIDLASVALHEVGHGLGFGSLLDWDNGIDDPDDPNDPDDSVDLVECNNVLGTGCYGTIPLAYERFVQTSAGTSILSFTNNSKALGDALIGDALVFNGPNAKAANGGVAPRLFAPTPWKAGSSIQHLREDSFPNIATGLMTPFSPYGTAIHHPGVVALGMLKDMGWEVYDLSRTYVDKNNTGLENGGVLHPFNTAFEGVNAVPHSGQVLFFAGNYAENLTISRPMTLESISGTVIIGK
ncbi:MAG: hypothetical protein ACI9EW_002650 [Cellvibrionaceae bacterium]|jgi:hypothetical protein